MGGGGAIGGVTENPTKGIQRRGGTGGIEGKLRWTKVGRRKDGRQGSKAPDRLGSRTRLYYSCHQQNWCSWSERGLLLSFFLLFFFLALILRDFLFFSSFLRLIDKPYRSSRVGWVDDEPAELVSYCLTPWGWAELTNAGWRRQTGQQGTRRTSRKNRAKLPSYYKLLPLPGGCFVLWFACYFPLVLGLNSVYKVLILTFFFVLVLFFQLVIFECLPHPLCGGARQFVSSPCLFAFFFFLSGLFVHVSFAFCFSLFPFGSLFPFIKCVCRACRTQLDDMSIACPLLCLLHTLVRGNAVSLWRSFVTTEVVSL